MFGALLTLALTLSTAQEAHAFYNVKEGEVVPNMQLPTLGGKVSPVLKKGARVNLFLFFSPEQESTSAVMREMADCMRGLREKPIHMVAIVSDSYDRDKIRKLVKDTGLSIPVLIDKGNKLYGKIGVMLTPTIGLATGDFKLAQYLPYRRLNYCHLVKAHVQFMLGEIQQAQLDAVVSPPKATQGGAAAKAKRSLKLARMLLKMKKFDKAEATVRKSIKIDPQLAEAHGLLALIFSAQGACEKASPAIAQALALSATEKQALQARGDCGDEASDNAETEAPSEAAAPDTASGAKPLPKDVEKPKSAVPPTRKTDTKRTSPPPP